MNVGEFVDVVGRAFSVPPIGGFRQTEVEDLHRAVRRDADVRRLQIAMDDAALVRRLERRRDLLARSAMRSSTGIGAARDPLREVLALDQFHDETRDAAFGDAVDLRDVGMVQRREHLRLAREARQPLRIAREQTRAGP